MIPLTLVNNLIGDNISDMETSPSLPLALRWMATDLGVTDHELAIMAGVAPGTAAAFFTRPNAAIQIWTTLLAALRCRLEVRTASRTLTIALPRISSKRREQERGQWAKRRLTAFRAQVQRQSPGVSPHEAEETATRYVESSAGRMGAELKSAQDRLTNTPLTREVAGLRAALRTIADAAHVKAEDLSLLAGVSLGAAQTVVDGTDEGRLAMPHRLLSAIAARLVILPAGGGVVTISLASPGDWRPEAPRTGQSTLSVADIRERVNNRDQTRESMADIARSAGVSRQRVHAIMQAETLRI